MNHEKIKENVFAFHHGELTEDERRETMEHVDACSDCRAELQRWERLSAAAFRRPLPEPSPYFVQRVMARIDDLVSPAGAGWRSLFSRWVFPAFVGLALSGFALVISTPQESASSTSEWIASQETPKDSQVLSYVMGDL